MRPTLPLTLGAIVASVAVSGVTSARQAPALAKYTDTIPNTKITFDMVPIPAGTFLMGSPATETGRNADEGPQHKVTLKAFYIGAKEVTWAEYDEFAFSIDLQRKRKLGLTGPKDAGDVVSRPDAAICGRVVGLGQGSAAGHRHHAVLGDEVLRVALGTYRQEIPAADRGRVGVRRARRHDDRLQLRRRRRGDRRLCLAQEPTARSSHTSAARRSRTPGACSTSMATPRSGRATCTTRRFYAQVAGRQPAQRPARSSTRTPCAAGRGTTSRRGSGVRPGGRRSRPGAGATPRIPKSLWWHTDATFVGFRVVAEP